ncbi:E3 ubiquitin/ISG15 ligase TRIM25-like [Salvelinus namaycush]|uniref:E3 ubiquitin/ISG15 ligase TRIM25-like n=1 Tax=Salvelinus namaycush TaxID=8040 RepID=A0A8U1FBX1_SALNM|nr:E3 ubiquitin/ISG15 ligase TRIM25-like [Salvelinus namaycush]
MAEETLEDKDLITCSICLDLLKDPVTTACGHSYCMDCIKDCWDQDDLKRVYSCPLCMERFTPKPVLKKNILLAELVEKQKKTGLRASPPGLCYAGPGDVECDVCTGRKLKAIKSCLVCLASYCKTHLQPHYESPAFKKHKKKLVEASTQLQEKIFPHHDSLLDDHCCTHQQCIFLLFVMDEHKGHDTVAAERRKKQQQRRPGHRYATQVMRPQHFQYMQLTMKPTFQAVAPCMFCTQHTAGYQPVLAPFHLGQIEAPAVDEWFRRSEETWDAAHVRLQQAIRRQKASADRHRSEAGLALNPKPTPSPAMPEDGPAVCGAI